MTIQDVQNLSLGQQPAFAVATPASQVAIVNTNNTLGVSCLPCEEQSCVVNATQAVNLDNNSFQNAGGTKMRFTFSNGGTGTRIIAIQSNLDGDTVNRQPDAYSVTGGAVNGIGSVSAFNEPLFIVDTLPNALPFQALNLRLAGGAVISQVTTNVTSANIQGPIQPNIDFSNADLTAYRLPADSHNSTITTVIYDPFCDACFSANNDGKLTKTYTMSTPTTFRNGLSIPVPAGASGKIELCYGIINLPNTQADTAAHQWL